MDESTIVEASAPASWGRTLLWEVMKTERTGITPKPIKN